MSSIQEDFDAWTDKSSGLLKGPGVDRQPTVTNNAILATAEAIVCLDKNGALTQDEIRLFDDALARLEVEPGVYLRNSFCVDQESQDDYTALVKALQVCGLKERLARIYLRGIAFKKLRFFSAWDYNRSTAPHAVEATFWRFPHITAHITFCTGLTPPFLKKVYWCLYMATQGVMCPIRRKLDGISAWLKSRGLENLARIFSFPEDLDGPKASYLMNEEHDGSSACRLAAWLWRRRFLRNWPGGMPQLYAVFYGANHPLAKWAPKL